MYPPLSPEGRPELAVRPVAAVRAGGGGAGTTRGGADLHTAG